MFDPHEFAWTFFRFCDVSVFFPGTDVFYGFWAYVIFLGPMDVDIDVAFFAG